MKEKTNRHLKRMIVVMVISVLIIISALIKWPSVNPLVNFTASLSGTTIFILSFLLIITKLREERKNKQRLDNGNN